MLTDGLTEGESEGDREGLSDTDGLMETEGLIDTDGLIEADGEVDGPAVAGILTAEWAMLLEVNVQLITPPADPSCVEPAPSSPPVARFQSAT
jgi:hypothetical protein